jgi:glycosyltransferase involved in cell wall biosynthesis
MKIAHVLVNYHPSIGGTQLLFKGISEKCVQQYNDEVEVLTIDSYNGSHSNNYKPIVPLQETVNGVHIKRYSFLRAHKFWFSFLAKFWIKCTGTNNTWLQLRSIGPWSSSLKKAIDNTNADVIVASSSGYLFMQYPLYRHTLKNPKPFVYQGAIHFATNENHQVISTNTLNAIKASEYYLANTQFEKDRLVQLGVDENMIVITGVATNVDFFANGNRQLYRSKLEIQDDEIVVGYVGRIEKTKSVDVLIQAFLLAKTTNKKLKLIIAGFETSYVQQLQQIITDEASLNKNDIIFIHDLKEEDKAHLFHAFDVFVLPSVNESFGIVFLEAWACKKPVIGTAIGAIKSVITNGVDGLLMEPENKESLVEKILELAQNEQMRLQLGINGYQKTITHYTWEAVTEKYRDTYLLAINKFNNVQRRSHLG